MHKFLSVKPYRVRSLTVSLLCALLLALTQGCRKAERPPEAPPAAEQPSAPAVEPPVAEQADEIPEHGMGELEPIVVVQVCRLDVLQRLHIEE